MNYLLVGVILIGIVCAIVGYSKGLIKIVVTLVATLATIFLVSILTPIVSDAVVQYTPLDDAIEKQFSKNIVGDEVKDDQKVSLSEQISLVEAAELPVFLKDALLNNNNNDIYKKLNVSSFKQYVGKYIASWIIKVCAFVLTFIVVFILVMLFVSSLNMIAELPVINGVNRISGAVCGLGVAIIIVWIGFIVLSLMFNTEIGQQCDIWIKDSRFLTMLYDNNKIMDILMKH